MPLFAQTGKPDFVEPEPTYAVPFGQIQEAQLIIQSQGGPSKCVSLSVLYMKDEGERIVPSNTLVVKDDKCKDIADGASETFAITIDPTQLQRPGKYKARLLIKKGERLAESKAMVTLIRGEPRLESSAPKKVVVTKWLPWSQGAEHKDITIREVSGLGGAARVSLSADSFLGPDKATLYPGNIDLEFIDIQGNQRLDRSISPNEQLGLRMSISGVTRTGELTTKIVVTSPSLKEPFLIPLTIVARDHGFWAFLTILGGVLMSWVAFRWAEQIKPRYQLELQISKLNDEIIECKTTSQNPAKLGFLEGLIVDLDEARSLAHEGNLEEAKNRLSAARTKFQEIKALSDQGTETRFTSSAALLVKAAFRFITLKRVDPSERERITARIKWMETSLTVAAIAVASLMAFLSLYQEKPFGSFGDYVAAFLWGFGFDASAKGFAPILNRLLGRKTP